MEVETNVENNDTLDFETDTNVVYHIGSIDYTRLENLLCQPQRIFGVK